MLSKKIFIFVFLIILFISDCSSLKYKKFSKSGYAMGTILTITFFSDRYKQANQIMEECFKLANELEKKVSCKLDDSIITSLNKTKDMVINDDFTYNLIIDSIKISKQTNGTFDPTLYNLSDTWGFIKGNNSLPTSYQIKKALHETGYLNIKIEGKRIILKNNISLDLGGIAKGKIINELSNFLKKNNITDYFVNGGGDLVIGGKYQGERPWKIAIINPFKKDDFIGVISLSNCSIVTSGDYERNFIGSDGKMYHHIMDPFTGYPADNGVHSVTLIFNKLSINYGLSAALFVMGKEKGLKFIKTQTDSDVIYISGNIQNPEISYSSNIKVSKNNDDIYDFIYLKK